MCVFVCACLFLYLSGCCVLCKCLFGLLGLCFIGGNDGRLGTVDGIYFASENKSGLFVLNWFVVGPPSPNTKLMGIVVDWGGV